MFFVLWVYIVVLVLVVCLCPSSVHVIATFFGTVLFPLLCSVLTFFAQYIDSFLFLVLLFQVSVSKISSVLFLNVVFISTQASLPNFNASLAAIFNILLNNSNFYKNEAKFRILPTVKLSGLMKSMA